jgi:NAD(P)H-dependent flavin oxidoreductase YrpB (nitropropane dioxygenase family)
MSATALPAIIQGGMGIGLSDWRLARAVSTRGQLGVVSGSLIDVVFVRRLQDGDPGGHMRRALERFPFRRVAEEALERYFKPQGRKPGEPYAALPMYQQVMARARQQLTMLAAFAEVHLAREGHDGKVGMNLLTKIALPNPELIYGAMIAGVDVILMGAGIPREIPGVLERLSRHEDVAMRLDVEGATPEALHTYDFSPRANWEGPLPEVRRPAFLPIVSSQALATLFARKFAGSVAGLVIESPVAGGHNAPPRGDLTLDEHGQPVYGARDAVDLEVVRKLGVPFWLAGGQGRPGALRAARELGAAGIQVGTLFAFCDESALEAGLKRSVLEAARRGAVRVHTDPVASPTGYPFKVVRWDNVPSTERERVCDLGYLRAAYETPDGRVAYRCPSEPEDQFTRKGGLPEATVGRQCLCNALLANVGLAQSRSGGAIEPPLLTSGDDLEQIGAFLKGRTHYGAAEVVDYLLDETPAN